MSCWLPLCTALTFIMAILILCVPAPPTFSFKKGIKIWKITFQMSAHCEHCKGDFILHHFTKDSHNHVTVAPRTYYMPQSSMPLTARKFTEKQQGCSDLSLSLSRIFCSWDNMIQRITSRGRILPILLDPNTFYGENMKDNPVFWNWEQISLSQQIWFW